MERFSVTGMSCAACSSRVEKAVKKVSGVSECSVSLLTNSMVVDGNFDSAEIEAAVKNIGYGAKSLSGDSESSSDLDNNKNLTSLNSNNLSEENQIAQLSKRLIFSVIILLSLMYFSMGYQMFGFPLPAFFAGNPFACGLLQMILAFIVMLINRKFFSSGIKSLIHGSPNMDTLVALGSGVSFAYSTVVLFLMTGAALELPESGERIKMLAENFYFEGAAMIVTLITVGKLLEAVSKGKTTSALKNLMKLAPKTAVVIREEKEIEIPVSKVTVGDIFLVKPGANIPVDGIVLEGESSVNESILTGESIPCDKVPGDNVNAATLNAQGFLKCRAVRVGEDTTLSQIIKMVSDGAATKAPVGKIADKVSGIFVPVVMSLAFVVFLVWLFVGADFGFALSRGIAVLVISCPCALGLATPVAIMVGNGKGAENGILFKNSATLEETGKVRIVALDKTGTITEGKPVVTDIYPAEDFDEAELLKVSASLEAKSEHPLAKAVLLKAEESGIKLADSVGGFEALSGNGIHGYIEDKEIFGGSLKFILGKISVPAEVVEICNKFSDEGKTPLLFSVKNKFAGIIAVADVVKADAKQAVSELNGMGIKVVMLTGDNQKTAVAIGKSAGIQNIVAGVLPGGKVQAVENLKRYGKVCMVGDGINDSPALTKADVGIAIGAGSDIAIDAAEVVLVKGNLTDVCAAIRLSRATLKNIKQNLFWAFLYNVIGIPLAAGAYFHAFGWSLNPMFCAAAMSLSSFCVVSNALRLNLVNLRKSKKYRKIKEVLMEDEEMFGMNKIKKTIKVEGMMCQHCEAHVKEALEKIDGVKSAAPDHEKCEVALVLSKEIEDSILEKAVTDAGYKFVK